MLKLEEKYHPESDSHKARRIERERQSDHVRSLAERKSDKIVGRKVSLQCSSLDAH